MAHLDVCLLKSKEASRNKVLKCISPQTVSQHESMECALIMQDNWDGVQHFQICLQHAPLKTFKP